MSTTRTQLFEIAQKARARGERKGNAEMISCAEDLERLTIAATDEELAELGSPGGSSSRSAKLENISRTLEVARKAAAKGMTEEFEEAMSIIAEVAQDEESDEDDDSEDEGGTENTKKEAQAIYDEMISRSRQAGPNKELLLESAVEFRRGMLESGLPICGDDPVTTGSYGEGSPRGAGRGAGPDASTVAEAQKLIASLKREGYASAAAELEAALKAELK